MPSRPADAVTELNVRRESWPIAGSFTISRGSKTEAEVVVVELERNGECGRGECVPYPRYDESIGGVIDTLSTLQPQIESGLDRSDLQEALPAGAARNALDCAMWDLDARESGMPVWRAAGLLEPPAALTTAYTLSLGTPEEMGQVARDHGDWPILKIKLTGDGDAERVTAIRENAPQAIIIADANEGWSAEQFEPLADELATLGVTLIEQPLKAGEDALLAHLDHPLLVCADESCHTSKDLGDLAMKYDAINIKLDKAGGLTEAITLKECARALGLRVMIGCMVSTSLSMAPAALLAADADFVDLDGPLLLEEDREGGLRFEGSRFEPVSPGLWG